MGRRELRPGDLPNLAEVEDLSARWARLEEEREFHERMQRVVRDLDLGTPWSEGWDET